MVERQDCRTTSTETIRERSMTIGIVAEKPCAMTTTGAGRRSGR
jgi:hypothetical protein